jgi:DNA polymerase-3 subunit beta
MKFSVARSELLEALSSAGRGLSSRSTLPILAGILVTAEGEGKVIFQATDLEISIKVGVEAHVEEEGQAVLPGKLVSDIVRSLPEVAVSVAVEGEMATITCGQASFSVKTLSPDDFPRFPELDSATKVSVDTGVLTAATTHVTKAVSRDETRPILTGVLASVDETSLKMVATDSYRLAVKETMLAEPSTATAEVVIPGRALGEVTRLAAGTESVEMSVGENQVGFSFGETLFITRRIEGTFPNYAQLLPKEKETSVKVPREEFLQAVKRVALLAQHNSPMRIAVSQEDQTLSLSANTQDVGDASEDLMATVEGGDIEIAFNHAFLADGLAVAQGEEIILEATSPLKPGVLTAPEDEGFLYLLMPVRLG